MLYFGGPLRSNNPQDVSLATYISNVKGTYDIGPDVDIIIHVVENKL